MSLKSLLLSILVSIFSMNSYAAVLDCHRKTDAKKKTVGAFYYEGAKPVLNLESRLFDSYGFVALPAGTYKLDDITDVEKVSSCRDGFEPTVQVSETKLDSGIEINVGVTCFDDPHVVTTMYEAVCTR